MNLEALVFDAYGTLFDVHSVADLCEQMWPGEGASVSLLWRTKQLEYTWQRSLMGKYEGFDRITADALRYACESLALGCGEREVGQLMQAYLKLDAFPEAKGALARLRGRKLAILSNGTEAMLEAVAASTGLRGLLDDVMSVDALRVFKPDPRVYQLAVDRLGVPRERIGFVSSNCWDACGAKAFGFRTFWISRGGAPVDRLGAAPDRVLRGLDELPGSID